MTSLADIWFSWPLVCFSLVLVCDVEMISCVCVSGCRAYLDVKELKEILNVDGSTHLNIFFANSSDEDLAGVATWPWDKEALTHLGTSTNALQVRDLKCGLAVISR